MICFSGKRIPLEDALRLELIRPSANRYASRGDDGTLRHITVEQVLDRSADAWLSVADAIAAKIFDQETGLLFQSRNLSKLDTVHELQKPSFCR